MLAGTMEGSDREQIRIDLLPYLRCPTDGTPLRLDESGGLLLSEDGSNSYPIINGAPVLIDFSKSVAVPPESNEDSGFEKRVNRPGGRLGWLLSGYRMHHCDVNVARMIEVLEASEQEPARVLVIGAGGNSPEVAALEADPRIDLIATDVVPGPGISVICDGHDIPLADGTVDSVVSQWVLEHVVDPERVVAEMHRVLRPGGLVYSEVPFIQQVHFGRHDFTRWTPSGHRRLYRFFDEISMSVVAGPGMALSWSFVWFLESLPSRKGRLSRWLSRLGRVVTLPLLLCDRWLIRRPGSWDAASGTAFLGRRREEPVPDDEIVAAYRGTNDAYFG